ncbi:MAG: nitrogen regulation protein NR(I) [Rhodospirillaceae bacterium]|nr:nitrogen regulation protein NR(I) [Rhodospirillaceae bacterium]|tara:strand:- start:19714 stop:21141 length:1428 start_codon:yes stop_codon:yes gene_type:complete
MSKYKVLLADDDEALRIILTESLLRSGYEVISLKNANELMEKVKSGIGDIVLTDVIMPDGDGIDLIQKIKKLRKDLPIIIMSARSNLLTAIRSNKEGAFDYLPKPFDINDLLDIFKRALYSNSKNLNKTDDIETDNPLSLIGKSKSMQDVFKTISKVVSNDLSILIIGESGTGKEVIAKTIHELSDRKNYPFIALNMAAIPKDLVESELFGHERGAFTGAINQQKGKFSQANDGTLFLDEIGDMPFSAQTRLLRVLQEKEFSPIGSKEVIKSNARIISASQNSLDDMVEKGVFRKDLFFRLNVIPISVPPLRSRKTDIPLLVNHFLEKIADEGLPKKFFSSKAIDLLNNYSWPGNIRELENLIKRLSILNFEQEISAEMVQNILLKNHDNINKLMKNNTLVDFLENKIKLLLNNSQSNYTQVGLYNLIVSEIEKPLIEICLKFTDGNQNKAAVLLGINRNTLRKKIKELKIEIHR